jgi:hypothetical protein
MMTLSEPVLTIVLLLKSSSRSAVLLTSVSDPLANSEVPNHRRRHTPKGRWAEPDIGIHFNDFIPALLVLNWRFIGLPSCR